MTQQDQKQTEAFLESIQRLRENQTPDTENQMFQELMRMTFLMPVEVEGTMQKQEDGSIVLSDGGSMRLPMISSQDDKHYFMAFTNQEEKQKAPAYKDLQSIPFTFDQYAVVVQDREGAAGVVIDPYGVNLILQRELVLSLKTQREIMKSGHSEVSVEKGAAVQLRTVSEESQPLRQALAACAKKQKEIKALYMQMMKQNEEESYVLVVDGTVDVKAMYPILADAARPHLHGMYLDITTINTEVGRAVLRVEDPFYKRMFYKKPELIEPFLAEVKDRFAMQNGSCVLGVCVLQGEMPQQAVVECLDEQGTVVFTAQVIGIEYGREKCKSAKVNPGGRFGSHYGLLIKDHGKEEFHEGYQLRYQG